MFNVYHPDAVELYSVCNSLPKVRTKINVNVTCIMIRLFSILFTMLFFLIHWPTACREGHVQKSCKWMLVNLIACGDTMIESHITKGQIQIRTPLVASC